MSCSTAWVPSAGKSFVETHSQRADALRPQSDGSSEYQRCTIGFEQVSRTDVGLKPVGNQRGDIHERLDRFARPNEVELDAALTRPLIVRLARELGYGVMSRRVENDQASTLLIVMS